MIEDFGSGAGVSGGIYRHVSLNVCR
jgi:hypothetical protein